MDSKEHEPLAVAGNGVATPLYFDGQVLQAGDLSLEQTARDGELARMRTMLHGWGVVAGLIPLVAGDTLVIGPGYGVLPDGGELYLPEPLSLPLPSAEQLALHCGGGTRTCELPEAGDGARAATDPVWLAVGPHDELAAPRPGMAGGCGHPANALRPTRRCHGVGLFLLCDLPAGHRPGQPGCAELAPFICADPAQPFPLPDPVDQEPQLLVLGRLVATEQTVSLELADRRRLLPNYLLQAWLQSCICPLTDTGQPPTRIDWQQLAVLIRRHGLDRLPRPQRPETVLGMYQPPRRGGDPAIVLLAGGGINGPADFLDADPPVIAALTAMTDEQVAAARAELDMIRRVIRI